MRLVAIAVLLAAIGSLLPPVLGTGGVRQRNSSVAIGHLIQQARLTLNGTSGVSHDYFSDECAVCEATVCDRRTDAGSEPLYCLRTVEIESEKTECVTESELSGAAWFDAKLDVVEGCQEAEYDSTAEHCWCRVPKSTERAKNSRLYRIKWIVQRRRLEAIKSGAVALAWSLPAAVLVLAAA